MKHQLLTYFFLGLCWSVSAQTLLVHGYVQSKTGEPLIGAQILTSNNQGVVTDRNGAFQLSVSDSSGILISYLGYESKKIDPKDLSEDLGTIQLQVSSTSLEEIIVSASSGTYRSDFSGANFIINSKQIQNTNPISTEESLRKIPGVNIVGDMGISNRPNISIRGSWGRRSKKVLLMEDGSPAAPAPYIAPGSYYNPVSDRIQSIEVYKGADMLRFGPNNMYGAVNYITALPPQNPELRLKYVAGQQGYQTGLISYGGTWGNLGSLVEGVYKKFDGFIDNSSVEILNLNAKIFAKLSDNQSLYFKISGQYENNHASLSSITPFTFKTDPTQNPFDADIFTMRRYGLDIIHKWLPSPNVQVISKLFATDFERDWWRQVTTKIKASEAESYLGEFIFNDRYAYLQGKTFTDDDYIRVGKITNGRESTTDSRWIFTVSGIDERLKVNWNSFGSENQLEVGFKLHQEVYSDRFLEADSSRWARYGTTTKDLNYHLWSASGFVRNEFDLGKLCIIPIMRIESIHMYKQDLIANANNVNLSGLDEERSKNNYAVVLPGISTKYEFSRHEFFASAYEGFIAPSKVFGFLIERDGKVTNPLANDAINMKPELSLNTEVGWRGNLLNNTLSGQLTYFNNSIRNFYAAGRNEVFEELGKINVSGLEFGIQQTIVRSKNQLLSAFVNGALIDTRIVSGASVDSDLFSQVIHTDETKLEFIEKVNSNRDSYDVYALNNQGDVVLLTEETLTIEDFNSLEKVVTRYGKDYVENSELPYTPKYNFTAGLNYEWTQLSAGISSHIVGRQFAEFSNFKSESADGAIGQIDSYLTLDAYANYEFHFKDLKAKVFINGKNLTNTIYATSRLNRATSGIFPGGFRMFMAGINIQI